MYSDLALIEVGGVKISLSNLINYFSVSGHSKQKNPSLTTTRGWGGGGRRPLCGGHHPKVPLLLTPPLTPSQKLGTLNFEPFRDTMFIEGIPAF